MAQFDPKWQFRTSAPGRLALAPTRSSANGESRLSPGVRKICLRNEATRSDFFAARSPAAINRVAVGDAADNILECRTSISIEESSKWRDEKASDEDFALFERGFSGKADWDELLKYQRVILLAEAGSGKSRELEERATKLTDGQGNSRSTLPCRMSRNRAWPAHWNSQLARSVRGVA